MRKNKVKREIERTKGNSVVILNDMDRAALLRESTGIKAHTEEKNRSVV